jgi:hypothetical protein
MKNKKSPSFVMLPREMLLSKEWQSLSRPAMLVYIYLKWRYNGANNGEISFIYKEHDWLYASATISKALKDLERNQWIVKTQHGGLYRYFCKYKLTGLNDVSVRGYGWQNIYKTSVSEVSVKNASCVDMANNEVLHQSNAP